MKPALAAHIRSLSPKRWWSGRYAGRYSNWSPCDVFADLYIRYSAELSRRQSVQYHNKYTMRAADIINEATDEGVDVVIIADYVASFLEDHAKFGNGYDIYDMENQAPLPEIHTEAANSMLYDHGLMFSIVRNSNIPKSPRGSIHLGAYLKTHKLIWINQRALANRRLLTSILVHELQHALDDVRSEGKALPTSAPDDTRLQYLLRPQEINARFSQAMYDIVDQQASYIAKMDKPWDGQTAKEMVRKILHRHSLNRETFPVGPKGQKAYERIVSRAHTFSVDVSKLIQPGEAKKRSLVDRIKLLIRSYLPL